MQISWKLRSMIVYTKKTIWWSHNFPKISNGNGSQNLSMLLLLTSTSRKICKDERRVTFWYKKGTLGCSVICQFWSTITYTKYNYSSIVPIKLQREVKDYHYSVMIKKLTVSLLVISVQHLLISSMSECTSSSCYKTQTQELRNSKLKVEKLNTI